MAANADVNALSLIFGTFFRGFKNWEWTDSADFVEYELLNRIRDVVSVTFLEKLCPKSTAWRNLTLDTEPISWPSPLLGIMALAENKDLSLTIHRWNWFTIRYIFLNYYEL